MFSASDAVCDLLEQMSTDFEGVVGGSICVDSLSDHRRKINNLEACSDCRRRYNNCTPNIPTCKSIVVIVLATAPKVYI